MHDDADQVVVTTEEFTEVITVDGEPQTVVAEREVVTVMTAAEQGPPGPPGVSGDKHFEQAFNVTDSITVEHNLGKTPAVTIINSANDEVEADIEHVNTNTLTASFSGAFSGKIICN